MDNPGKFTTKVLVVDDHPLTRIMLAEILRQLGFSKIREAEDGSRALAIIGKDLPGLLFTDLDMPNMSGLELIQELRQQSATRELPVIVVSGASDQDMVLKALEAGADSFVVKPFSSAVIKKKIVQVLRRQAQQGPSPASL